MRNVWEEILLVYIHTYIIGHYNPLARIIDLVSHTTYVVCVNFIHKWRGLQFKVDSERQIFWGTFPGNYIYSQSFCQKSAERKWLKKNFSYLVLMSGLGFSSHKPKHYLLHYGDFISHQTIRNMFDFPVSILDRET